MIGIGGGIDIRCSDYAEYGTQALSEAMLKAMEGRSACLLGNHGQIVFGYNLENALWRAGEVEAISHQYWAALQAGKPVILTDAQMTTVLARFKTYGKQPEDLAKGDALSVIGPERRDEPKKSKKKSKK
jgi:L-fuculose-phosphate aldolase